MPGMPLLQRVAEGGLETSSLRGASYASEWASELCVDDPVRAAVVNARALARYAEIDDALSLADVLTTNGRIERFLGRPAAALSDCTKALTASQTSTGPSGQVRSISALLCMGHAQLDLGDARGAVTALERATDAGIERHPLVRADLEFTLARALVANRQTDGRARALAESAVERLRPFPALSAERADIEAWLASPSVKPRRLR